MSYERECGVVSCFICDEPCQRLNLRKEKQREKAEMCMRYRTLATRFLRFNLPKGSSNLEKVQRPHNFNTLKSKANLKKILKECKSDFSNNNVDADVGATATSSICDTCYEIASSFCETYFNWNFLQLLLDQRTKEIAQRMEKVDVRKLDAFRRNFLIHAGHNATKYPELKLRKLGDYDGDDVVDDDDGHKKPDAEKWQRRQEIEVEVDLDQKETLYKCVLCGDEFLENQDFLEHLQIHYSENGDKREDDKKDLEGDHLKLKEENDELSETENEDFEFETLLPDGMEFNRKYDYMTAWHGQEHQQEQEELEVKPPECKRESEPSSVKEEILSFSSAQLQCEFCGRVFARMCHLMNHMRVHRTKRHHQQDVKFLCSCGKTFTRKCHFKNHSRMHKPFKRITRGKPFPCRSTRSSENLTLRNPHLRCRFCGKEFQQATAYKVHSLRQHMPHLDLELD